MVFLTKEDKEIWKKYSLNMNQLRLDIKKFEVNTNNVNIIKQIKKNNNKSNNSNTLDKFIIMLNKGRIKPDGIVDLHGFNLNEAKIRLKNYVFDAFNKNKRNILIITGKGLNKTGLLKKEVPIWLNEKDIKKILINYKNAPKSFGGEGALIVRLKNKQKI